MKKVTILGLYNSMATTIFGPMDIFNQAGRLWPRVNNSPATPYFDVTLASPDGKAIQSQNNILIQPHCGIKDIEHTDLIVIASATHMDKILKKHPDLPDWIITQYHQGAHVASICTGAFLLAQTGLLDGKSATLHWGFTQMFRQKYPLVQLDPSQMIIDHGRLYCSAGVSAGMDLSLYLVEKFLGRQAAVQSAKTMILDMGRQSQKPYTSFQMYRGHGDQGIIQTQKWIEQHYTQPVDYDWLAKKHGMSRRSLERRFKKATGLTPLAYLQQLRVEAAKGLLEQGNQTFNEITFQVGYEDISFFRKLFVRLTGLRPKEYQERIAGGQVGDIGPETGADA